MTQRETEYKRLRRFGRRPVDAWRAADTITRFERAEDAELVRLSAEPEYINYFDVYGEPEGYQDRDGRHHSADDERAEIVAMIEDGGCWTVYTETLCPYCHEWRVVDSVGMCLGYHNVLDPAENWYVEDLMSTALDELERAAC